MEMKFIWLVKKTD